MKFPNKTTLETFTDVDLEDAIFWQLLVECVDEFMALKVVQLDQVGPRKALFSGKLAPDCSILGL